MIITIDGPPIPLKRHRTHKGITYDPQAAIKEGVYWEICSLIGKQQESDVSVIPMFADSYIYKYHKGAFEMELTFFMPIPKSLSQKRKKTLVDQYHHKKPDIDNLVKFYLDACRVALYIDDSQVAKLITQKTYSTHPRTEIRIDRIIPQTE